jgi:hypothetical protein
MYFVESKSQLQKNSQPHSQVEEEVSGFPAGCPLTLKTAVSGSSGKTLHFMFNE